MRDGAGQCYHRGSVAPVSLLVLPARRRISGWWSPLNFIAKTRPRPNSISSISPSSDTCGTRGTAVRCTQDPGTLGTRPGSLGSQGGSPASQPVSLPRPPTSHLSGSIKLHGAITTTGCASNNCDCHRHAVPITAFVAWGRRRSYQPRFTAILHEHPT